MEQGAERLADELLRLAEELPQAASVVLRLTENQRTLATEIRRKLSGLRRRTAFVDWRGVHSFGNELAGVIKEIEVAEFSSEVTLELVSRFFECDASIFNRCDDSSGYVGAVFRHDAAALFSQAAKNVKDDQVLQRVFDLTNECEYGVRGVLLEKAPTFLDETHLKQLLEKFRDLAEAQSRVHSDEDWQVISAWVATTILAKEIGDPEILRDVVMRQRHLAGSLQPLGGERLEVARSFLQAGRAQEALDWMNQPTDWGRWERERQELLLEVHSALGNLDQVAAIARDRFDELPSVGNLNDLVSVVGEVHRSRIVRERVESIVDQPFGFSELHFLVDLNELEAAARYVIAAEKAIDGYMYGSLLEIADWFQEREQWLASSVIYRALLVSILEHKRSSAYGHAARYLRKLRRWAPKISTWQGLLNQVAFEEGLRAKHGLKRKFWGMVSED